MRMMRKMLTRTCKIQYLLFVFMNLLLLDDKNAAAAVVVVVVVVVVLLQKLTTAISFSAPLEDISLWT
jgi:chromate transport protein ChrA